MVPEVHKEYMNKNDCVVLREILTVAYASKNSIRTNSTQLYYNSGYFIASSKKLFFTGFIIFIVSVFSGYKFITKYF